MRIVITILLFLVPAVSQAAVLIHEVAWMGGTSSANDEWIELFNSGGSVVSLDGWTLTDNMNLSIELAGTVGAGEYAVLERTDDTSAPGDAFLLYTGALTNTGATLTLVRDDGGVEDQVAGGDDWDTIGGDNVIKETAQYTSSGWITGSPTPGSPNISFVPTEIDTKVEDTEDDAVVVQNSGKKATEKKYMVLPDWTLELELTAPTIAYVNQPIAFSVSPSGIGDLLLRSVQFAWNFGDLTVGAGNEVVHQYRYPGTYVVVIDGSFKRHHAAIRHEITILPVTFSLTKNTRGDLQIHNDAPYEVDLSGYSVRGNSVVELPNNTFLLPRSTITLPKEKVGSTHALLFDQAGTLVASTIAADKHIADVTPQTNTVVEAPPILPAVSSQQTAAHNQEQFSFGGEESDILHPDDFLPSEDFPDSAYATQTALVHDARVSIENSTLPYMGLIGLLSLGVLALYATRIQK